MFSTQNGHNYGTTPKFDGNSEFSPYCLRFSTVFLIFPKFPRFPHLKVAIRSTGPGQAMPAAAMTSDVSMATRHGDPTVAATSTVAEDLEILGLKLSNSSNG